MTDTLRINVGCGSSPTPGWLNFDGSPTVRLAQHPVLATVVRPLLDRDQRRYLAYCRSNAIRYADATRLPCEDQSVDVVYASHIVEHLYPVCAHNFLMEARRVLRVGGILRLAVPDLERLVHGYCASGDAQEFIVATLLGRFEPTPLQRLFGDRGHKWMYDARSLTHLVERTGFYPVEVMSAGTTRITNPGALNLSERATESVYVEGVR